MTNLILSVMQNRRIFLVVTELSLHVGERFLRNECLPFNNGQLYNQLICLTTIGMTRFSKIRQQGGG